MMGFKVLIRGLMLLTTTALGVIAFADTAAKAAAPATTAAAVAPRLWHEPLTGMAFVALPKGCFQMGSKRPALDAIDSLLQPFARNMIKDEQPRHEACVDAFFLGQTEVRASEWRKVMAEKPPAGSGKAPAGGIGYAAAQAFAQRLTKLSAGKYQFRLPTEAEWEYACRAGEEQDSLPYENSRTNVAWYSVTEHRSLYPAPVGLLRANAWGLQDMLGNVWEWVSDGYRADAYAQHRLYNPRVSAPANGEQVMRGASHRSEYIQVRCANRSSYPASATLDQIGLRLVRQP